MTTFPDLDHYEDESTTPDELTLPISGKEYTFSGRLSFGRALQFQVMRAEGRRMYEERRAAREAGTLDNYTFEPSTESLDVMQNLDDTALYFELIGDEMRQKLIDDHVPYDKVLHVGATLFAWHLNGTEVARRVWARGKLEDDDVRPPGEGGASSDPPTTSPTSTTRKKPRNSGRKPAAARASSGRTTSTGGGTSKRTSTASTART